MTCKSLFSLKNIIGIKEAGDENKIANLLSIINIFIFMLVGKLISRKKLSSVLIVYHQSLAIFIPQKCKIILIVYWQGKVMLIWPIPFMNLVAHKDCRLSKK